MTTRILRAVTHDVRFPASRSVTIGTPAPQVVGPKVKELGPDLGGLWRRLAAGDAVWKEEVPA